MLIQGIFKSKLINTLSLPKMGVAESTKREIPTHAKLGLDGHALEAGGYMSEYEGDLNRYSGSRKRSRQAVSGLPACGHWDLGD
jgi:hypothetical protein